MNPRLITSLSDLQVAQLVALYQGEWWTCGRKYDDVKTMLQFSDFVFAYVDPEGNLIAFARVLSDRVFKALLFDVIISPQYRACGLGRALLGEITAHPVLAKVKHIELYCLPELQSFYQALGFSSDTAGVSLLRKTNVDTSVVNIANN